MSKKAISNIAIAVLGPVLFASSLYAGVAFYHRNVFGLGTVINDIDVSGLTVVQANEKLSEAFEYDGLTVIDKNGEEYLISTESIGFGANFVTGLQEIKDKNHPLTWGKNFISDEKKTIVPEVTYSSELLDEELLKAPFMDKQYLYNPNNTISIEKTADAGYQIVDRTKDLIHEDMALTLAENGVSSLSASVNLWDGGCYESIDRSSLEAELKEIYTKIDAFQSFHLEYDILGQKEVIDSSVTADWITLDDDGNFLLDEEGNLVLDEEKVAEYVSKLAEKYDTKAKERTFRSTSGKEIHFDAKQVLYGTSIDQKKEVANLIQEIKDGETNIEREPAFLSKAFCEGADDVGDTYIEINMTEQHLYYYKEGKIFMESDFVSGNLRAGMSSPELFAYVRNKAKNVILRGPGYESFVYYWMGIWQGYGMHDATWRGRFGGEIYKTNGSHGCINLPLKFIGEFFPEVEVGTPLIMFYEPVEPELEPEKPAEEIDPNEGKEPEPGTPQPAPEQTPAPAEQQPAEQPAPEQPAPEPAPEQPAPEQTQ
ncbi:MAG: L,D-transpeptidase/peptidoglycan binding protein [Lachnospiraceae bacterium]|nr:L,D-transpeptidase/peptidoglycan binding protein [Lachnospiraceae bacterium]